MSKALDDQELVATAQIRAGALVRGRLRAMLRMEAPEITFVEDKGFLASWFTINGPEDIVRPFYNNIVDVHKAY